MLDRDSCSMTCATSKGIYGDEIDLLRPYQDYKYLKYILFLPNFAWNRLCNAAKFVSLYLAITWYLYTINTLDKTSSYLFNKYIIR